MGSAEVLFMITVRTLGSALIVGRELWRGRFAVSKTISDALNRRSALLLAAGTAATAVSNTVVQTTWAAARPSDIVMMDGVALAGAIRSREISCVEVMTAYLNHIEKMNPYVNAIVALQEPAALLAQSRERDSQLARGEWMGPLHGFPHAVKELAAVKGIKTTKGSPLLKDFVPSTDSVMVERLRKAGA